MKTELEHVHPAEIERRSFSIISQELGPRTYAGPYDELILKRVIHASADFDNADHLVFSPGAVESAMEAIRAGADIVTDTQMAKAGINKTALARFGGQVRCFMSDPDVAREAGDRGTTRAAVCMERAQALQQPLVFAVGNAPTALVRLYELVQEGRLTPALIIGVPVGFVNVVASKELIEQAGAPYIVARGRKGGSNVAAAICNGILYQMK